MADDLTSPQDAADSASVDHLEPGMTGRWLLTSQGSQHLLDLDEMTWTRFRGEGRQATGLDGHTLHLSGIEIWPQVGISPLFSFPDPGNPDARVQYFLSALRKIERVDAPQNAADLT